MPPRPRPAITSYHLLLLHLILQLLLPPSVTAQSGAAVASACPAVNNEVPFYLDPSVNLPGSATQINGPVGPCTTCKQPTSVYFANAGSPAPFNGATFPGGFPNRPAYMASVYGPSPGNNFATILNCPNACVCNANGLCATVTTPNTNFALYPLCCRRLDF